MRTPHTATWKGKKVRVRLRDGRLITGKFKEKKSRFVFLEDGEKISIAMIANFSILKDRRQKTSTPNSRTQ